MRFSSLTTCLTMATSFYVQLDNIRSFLDVYALPVILIVGNLTNLINAFVFSRRRMWTNVCSWYFFCLSLAHLLLLNSSCLPRLIVTWSGYDYGKDNAIYCKIRSYLFHLSLLLSRQFITLISIDRWLITSAHVRLRRQSSPQTTRWLIAASILCSSLYSIHVLVGYGPNTLGCYPAAGAQYTTFASMDAVIAAILPLVSDSFHSNRVSSTTFLVEHGDIQPSRLTQSALEHHSTSSCRGSAGASGRRSRTYATLQA